MDPTLELQAAIIARLRAYSAITDIVAMRIYDEPPSGQAGNVAAVRPYVSLGPCEYAQDDADCIVGGEVTMQIDAISDKPGRVEIKQMAQAIRKAFRDYEFSLTDNALVLLEHTRTNYIAAGGIKQAALTFTAIIEEP